MDNQTRGRAIDNYDDDNSSLDSPIVYTDAPIALADIRKRRYYIIDRAQIVSHKTKREGEKKLGEKNEITKKHAIFFEILESMYPNFSIEKNYAKQDDKIVVQKELYIIYKILKDRKNICFDIPFVYYDLGPYSNSVTQYIEDIYGQNQIEQVQKNIKRNTKEGSLFLLQEVYDAVEELKLFRKLVKRNLPDIYYPLALCMITSVFYTFYSSKFVDKEIYDIKLSKMYSNFKAICENLCRRSIITEDMRTEEIFSYLRKLFILLKFWLQDDLDMDTDLFDVFQSLYQDAENITVF